ncbi:PKMYT1: Protein kinase membrane associated tyrosine/threonine 1 [Crotalus adamanteus]|uniref:non-specific serine/threonine protein kinase n=1 Tax=Crotalus adamanteus TaxID=8729 RepID=A0AAW1AZW0_CROAD
MLELDSGDLKDAQEGDPRYMAPELLHGEYTKAADVFGLGITILEIACNMELPNGGEGWQQHRQGLSVELQKLLVAMLEPDNFLWPSVEILLNSSLMQKTEVAKTHVVSAIWDPAGCLHVQVFDPFCSFQALLRFIQWLWGALCSPAQWLLFWHQTVPVTPPHSPFLLLLENNSLSSDWGEEDEGDEESLGKAVLDLSEINE